MPPLQGWMLFSTLFYKHTVATRLKRFLKSSRFPCKIRFGWNADRMNQRYEGSPYGIPRGEYAAKPNLPGLGGQCTVIVEPVIICTCFETTGNNALRMNQRYECLMAFPGANTPQNCPTTNAALVRNKCVSNSKIYYNPSCHLFTHIALRWSAGRLIYLFYRHFTPLGWEKCLKNRVTMPKIRWWQLGLL